MGGLASWDATAHFQGISFVRFITEEKITALTDIQFKVKFLAFFFFYLSSEKCQKNIRFSLDSLNISCIFK